LTTILSTGLSKGKKSTTEAVKEAVRQAKERIGENTVDLSIVYSSSEYNYSKVVEAVRAATNNAPLIGASSAGEFNEKKVESGSVAVGLLSSDDIKIFTAFAEGIKQDPEAALEGIAAKLPVQPEGYPHLTAIMLADGLSGVGEEVTLLASYHLGEEVRIVGGMAGDDLKMEKTFVFCDDNVYTNAISICLLASKMPLFTGVKHGHRPISKALEATRAKGNVLYEINGKPAWEIWKKETTLVALKRGIDIEKLATPAEISTFLLNYSLGLTAEKEGEYKIRWPESINEDGSLNFTCSIAEGAIFRIMDGFDLEKQIDSAWEAASIAKQSAQYAGYSDFAGILVFDCAVRQIVLQDRFPEAVNRFKNVFPGIPLLGWETYGEISLEPGQYSGFHNTTSVVLLLPADDKPE